MPHDTLAFTQGLVVNGNRLLEGTGLPQVSYISASDVQTGRRLATRLTPGGRFGEGIASLGTRLTQLTWQERVAYVYDLNDLTLLDSIQYEGEGWGLTTNDSVWFMSDGTATIRVRDTTSFRVLRELEVREGVHPVRWLNELEWVNGELWANVYQTDLIARINPSSGSVLGWIDMSHALTAEERKSVFRRRGTLNGIAFDEKRGQILLTGKYWPKIVVIKSPSK